MNDKTIDNPIFSYAKKSSSRNVSLALVSVIAGVYFGVIMGFYNVVLDFFFSDVESIFKNIATGVRSGLFFGVWTYVTYGLLIRFMKNRPGMYIAPIPTKFGKVLAHIRCNHQQNKIAIGGQLYVCELGMCFCPVKFNWPLKPSVFEASWGNVQCIYKSSGRLTARGFLTGGIRDRLAFEINNADQFFVVENVDKLIEDINIVVKKSKDKGQA